MLRGQGFFFGHQVTTPKQFERPKICPKIFLASQKEMERGNEKEKLSV
jgi:hypothetical protein